MVLVVADSNQNHNWMWECEPKSTAVQTLYLDFDYQFRPTTFNMTTKHGTTLTHSRRRIYKSVCAVLLVLVGEELEDALDLHRDAQRQRRQTHGGPGVHALISKDLHHKIRAPINNSRLLCEVIDAVHETRQFHNPFDSVQIFKIMLQSSTQIQSNIFRCFVTLFDCQFFTNPSDNQRTFCWLLEENTFNHRYIVCAERSCNEYLREMTGKINHISDTSKVDKVPFWNSRTRHCQPEFSDFRFHIDKTFQIVKYTWMRSGFNVNSQHD